jgi:UDP-N-acetylglucosamine 2-epimerase (non-hydrolysing)
MRKNILIVFGTRPEAIKMAPLCHEFKKNSDFNIKVCVTGQHREMLDQVLRIFEIEPDFDINIMLKGQDLFDVTSRVLMGMREILRQYRPDLILVHGDTSTTFASSVAGFYEGIPVGHVEAGLRTHNISAPFPEEFNRRVTGIVSKYHFAPTKKSRKNLIDERTNDRYIWVTGNTVIDALHWVLNKIQSRPALEASISKILDRHLNFGWKIEKFVLITGHRRENFGDGFLSICEAIRDVATDNPLTHFVYPVHLNPNVQQPVTQTLGGLDNVHLIPPLEYEAFVYLLMHCHLVLTDSGGIQEEAPSLGKPVLVMRDVTERPEAVDAGTVILVGTCKKAIIKNINMLLRDPSHYSVMSEAHNPYGNGDSSRQIVEIIRKEMSEK